MNKQLWNLYKESEKGKACIVLFDPEIEDTFKGINDVFEYSKQWGGENIDAVEDLYFLYVANFSVNKTMPEEWTRELYAKFIEEYKIIDVYQTDEGEIVFYDDAKAILISQEKYRIKAANISIMSMALFYSYEFFKPILLPQRFDTIQKNCDLLGIELPKIPRTKDYKDYLLYYYDICTVWNEFQKENELTDAEFCACLYDYAPMLQDSTKFSDLPKPINVWLTGASGKGDFEYLDALGENVDYNKNSIWASNERTHRGDIIIVYCTSPRSYIHSIWRANSAGIFNPFDYYHCRTTVCDGIKTPEISFNDLKSDQYFSQIPIVRKNLQGINGIELTSKDYSELLRLIEEKGGDINIYPKLFEASEIDFGEIKLEKDVEEKILMSMLKNLGYKEEDWTRQLSQKAGRGLKAIPDFVFFPKGEKHFASAPFVIEVKLDMSLSAEQQNAFSQALSYARMLRSLLMGICDKERLIIYKIDTNGSADRNNPIFEDYWASIYENPEIGAHLNQLIGREIVMNL